MKKIFALLMTVLGFCLVAISACSPPPVEPSITLSVSQEKVVLSNGESEMIFASLTKDGQEVNCSYSFALHEESNDGIVTMAIEQESVTFSHKSAGTVKVVCTATFENKVYQKEITVVANGKTVLENEVYVEYVLNGFILPSEVTGEVNNVIYNGASVFTGVEDGIVKINLENFEQGKLEKQLIINTESMDYFIDAEYVAMIINDENEFFAMQDVAYELGDHAGGAPTLEGLFYLGNDIYIPNDYFYETKYKGHDWDGGFRGTLDGKGHRVRGLTMRDSNMLFHSFMGDGVGLKDILFIDCVKKGGGAFLCDYRDSAFVNVYVHMKEVVCSQDTYIIQRENHGSSVSMRNVMVVIDKLTDGTNAGKSKFSFGVLKWQNRNLNNVNKCRAINCAFVCDNDYAGVEVHGLYTMPKKGDDSYMEEMPVTRSIYALNESQDNWDSEFWIVDEGTPYPKSEFYW